MAFLDNSGDIILDAVLTETGRRRMANGNFSIAKFALGDDEINYSQYDINHPSGSAYYDLEILQTPIFEAATSKNATINYGLLSLTKTNILYIPSIVVNQTFQPAVQMSGTVVYVSANQETYDRVRSTSATPRTALGANGEFCLLGNSQKPANALYIESGLDTVEEDANSAGRFTFITSQGMLDSQFAVSVDSKFINGMYQLAGSDPFLANESSEETSIPRDLTTARGGRRSSVNIDNYNDYMIRGVDNLLFAPVSAQRADQSALKGPRGSGAAMNFSIRSELTKDSQQSTPQDYQKYGKTAQNIFGSSDLYDYIDTTVYVVGIASTATAQLPLRIIRYSGT